MKKLIIITILIFSKVVFSEEKKNNFDIKKIQAEFNAKIRKYTLDNGIRVILLRNKTSPTIACYLKIGVGSADEPFNQAGTAHFLEHLLFKGTDTVGTNNFDKEKIYLKEIEIYGNRVDRIKRELNDPLISQETRSSLEKELSVSEKRLQIFQKYTEEFVVSEEDSHIYSLAGQTGYNAYTNTDVTNYQIKLPSNRLELWAYMESSRFLNPVFREFYSERKVIKEERNMRYDSRPSSLLYELFNKTAYGMSPYGKPVIGYAENILQLTFADTLNFFKENYIPSKMVIAIAGDIEFDEAILIIKKHFEKIPDKSPPGFPSIPYQNSQGKKTAILEAESTPYLLTGWAKGREIDPENAVFDVLQNALTSGQNSRLVQRLIIREKIASGVEAYNGLPGGKLTNHFVISVNPYSEKDYERVQNIINEEIAKIGENGLDESEFIKIKNSYFKSIINSLDSNAGMAELLSYYELIYFDYNELFQYLAKIEKVNNEQIKEVIKSTFVDKKNTTVWINTPLK